MVQPTQPLPARPPIIVFGWLLARGVGTAVPYLEVRRGKGAHG